MALRPAHDPTDRHGQGDLPLSEGPFEGEWVGLTPDFAELLPCSFESLELQGYIAWRRTWFYVDVD